MAYEMSSSAHTGRPATDVIDVMTDLFILRGFLRSSGQRTATDSFNARFSKIC